MGGGGSGLGGLLLLGRELRAVGGFVLLDQSSQRLVAGELDVTGGLGLVAGGGTEGVDLGEVGDAGVFDDSFAIS